MRKLFFLLTTIVFSLSKVAGQVSISLQEPPAGIVQRSQLWNLTMIYSGTSPINVSIGLALVDPINNQPVMTAQTRPFALTKGIKILKPTDVSPIDYVYQMAKPSRISEEFIPIGSYRACYTVYNTQGHSEEILSEDCMAIEVAPLSPPQLSQPEDGGSVQTHYPQFAWLPPTPAVLFSDLNYDLVLTEVKAGQSPQEALQENIPLYNSRRILAPTNSYPASNKSLDTGKLYAWRIFAKTGETLAAASDVWTFKVTEQKPPSPSVTTGEYLELRNGFAITNTAFLTTNVARIKFYSYDQTHESVLRIYDEHQVLVKEIPQTISYGSNFFTIKLDRQFKVDATYFIELFDLQHTAYRSSFRISKP